MTRALVTGAGKRLGRAMALYLAGRGFDVAVHYASSAEAAEDTAAEIRALGRSAITLQADLTREAEMQGLVPAAAEGLGGELTCLVNSASVFEYDTLYSATRESWDRHLESNLRAPFVLIQAMAAQAPAPVNDAQGEPVSQALVVNMLDAKVRKLTPGHMSYTLAKTALWTLTQTAAMTLGPKMRVNAIGPGPTLIGANQPEEHFARMREACILGRGSNPADITAALGYFLDAPAVTGQLLCVDGGQHLIWQTPDERRHRI
ncbi:short chain dehydrogenase [Oceanicola granulosus HTCC2516]|uniref:Short chain dehydrogenase n=1 Tax=Oceanicola granulosus (strain ATCC BAA-861 / DSM 15982 / KCTC 12143 / HTCC2516) TaxID=314256 RepID=Q2CCH7_OCEGH|nr:SDR family oxidoreductase [Oceanicola granulosus]EAR50341.1 short chain dehydrogenase [Oceanicola granulosus HTCC2516]